MLNYETLLSSYDDKLTLMQWLKKVEAALKDASAVSFKVNKRGDATLTFSVVFEDGSEIETGPIILQQGESVSSASIVNGHLIIMLTNGDALDAGDLGGVSGFSIDASQHLIVTYQSGSTQDLGAVFDGATIKLNAITSDNNEIQALKPVVEVMDGYEYVGTAPYVSYSNLNMLYAGAVKNGNKLTFSLFFKITRQTGENYGAICRFKIPPTIYDMLVSNTLDVYSILDIKNVDAFSNLGASVSVPIRIQKTYDDTIRHSIVFYISLGGMLEVGTEYLIRIEETFLLSENLAA